MKTILSLFGFHGRMRRVQYAILALVTMMLTGLLSCAFVLSVIALMAAHGVLPRDIPHDLEIVLQSVLAVRLPLSFLLVCGIVSAVLLIAVHVAWIAGSVRRLHDMNMRGWTVMISLILVSLGSIYNLAHLPPYTGYVMVALVLGLWPPSKDADRFGPDPRSQTPGVA